MERNFERKQAGFLFSICLALAVSCGPGKPKKEEEKKDSASAAAPSSAAAAPSYSVTDLKLLTDDKGIIDPANKMSFKISDSESSLEIEYKTAISAEELKKYPEKIQIAVFPKGTNVAEIKLSAAVGRDAMKANKLKLEVKENAKALLAALSNLSILQIGFVITDEKSEKISKVVVVNIGEALCALNPSPVVNAGNPLAEKCKVPSADLEKLNKIIADMEKAAAAPASAT